MDYKEYDIKKLSRSERIREEAKRALEYGQAPKCPLSLHPNFRVERLTPTAPPAPRPPGARFLQLGRMSVVTTREDNPLLRKGNPSYVAAQIDDELQQLSSANRVQRAGKLLELLGRLHIADPYRQSTSTLRRRVLTALFGENLLKCEHDLPKERGPRSHGGSVGPEDKGRD